MKKTYLNPAIEVADMELTEMIAASGVEGFDSALDETGTDGGSALGRDLEDALFGKVSVGF